MSTFDITLIAYLGICVLLFIIVMLYGIYDDYIKKTYKHLQVQANLKSFDFYFFALLISIPFINLATLLWFVLIGATVLFQSLVEYRQLRRK